MDRRRGEGRESMQVQRGSKEGGERERGRERAMRRGWGGEGRRKKEERENRREEKKKAVNKECTDLT